MDRSAIRDDGQDLAFVTVQVADAQGTPVPRADIRQHFSVEGPGEIVATDNGDATDLEAFPSSSRKAFSGKALAIVRRQSGQSGSLHLVVRAEGWPRAGWRSAARDPAALKSWRPRRVGALDHRSRRGIGR